ncbi:molybdenum cofactor sulfurase [Arenicella chitinivorans]|uniref:Molybdenum cofactor sulfurase n=1 Tax=Arenicella chitinivorans TaxID=1329800 RepID=A0A918VIF1_9GAMM|nr:MOSC N-terminal beta barrel domain-containing protein [Arenicella chitinivorans]GHA03958.1 molybdenum cofactor sulfurase [Arenicella chitinivorans]
MDKLTISGLYLHPLKSAAALIVEALNFDSRGPQFDRHWMVVDQNGKFRSQRHHPKMSLIEPVLHAGRLSLKAPGMPRIDLGQPGSSQSVTVWDDTLIAGDCGATAANWMSEYLGVMSRVVVLTQDSLRRVDRQYSSGEETVGFADGYPCLIASQASLDDLNQYLKPPIDMRRFRPNIVISGSAPYAEDQWQKLKIGDMIFDLVKPCSRCIIPSIDPDSGEKQMAVNQVLMAHRRRGRNTFFGQNAIHQGRGELRIGQTVEVISEK